MIETKSNITIRFAELEFINQGQDHAVFRHKGNARLSDQYVVKIKKDRSVELETEPEKNKQFFKSEDAGDMIHAEWFSQLHSYQFRGLFADMHFDFRAQLSPKNLLELSLDFKGNDSFFSAQHPTVTFSKNLYYSHQSGNRKLGQFFLELKPKCVLKQKISRNSLAQFLPELSFESPECLQTYNANKKYYRKLTIHRILKKKSVLLNFFDKKKFQATLKNLCDSKFCIFSTNTDKLERIKMAQLAKNLDLNQQSFGELLQRCYFFKHDFYGQRATAASVLERFQSLFPYPWFVLEPYMSSLGKVELTDQLLKKIFDDLRSHVIENRRYRKGDMKNPQEVLKAVIFALISNVFSDCSVILDVISFKNKEERTSFVAANPNYQSLQFKKRHFAFKMNAIDLEMKRLWKIQEYIGKEKKFFKEIFASCKVSASGNDVDGSSDV